MGHPEIQRLRLDGVEARATRLSYNQPFRSALWMIFLKSLNGIMVANCPHTQRPRIAGFLPMT